MSMHEQSEALDRRLTPDQRDRAFAKLLALGWQSGHPVPHHVWQRVAIEAMCEGHAAKEAAYSPRRFA
jgi:hypothetical protein